MTHREHLQLLHEAIANAKETLKWWEERLEIAKQNKPTKKKGLTE